jgi:membrane-bound serine protease (ClpP class)
MPTNWLAVILIVVGVSAFLVVPFVKPTYGQFADAGLLLQAAGAFTLFNGLSVSPLLILTTIGLAWVYHRLALLPAMRAYRDAAAQPTLQEALIGSRGYVTRALNPAGTVSVDGEIWTARSEEPLDPGIEIVVIDQKGLELRVEKAKRSQQLADLLQSNGIHKY